MAELFPEDPKLSLFASRFQGETFDPTAVRPVVSPASQMRPRNVMQSIEQNQPLLDSPRPQYIQEASRSPRPQYVQAVNSPKRPFPIEDSDNDRPRKLARGESPLKGAAGRRLDQQKRLQQNQGTPAWQSSSSFVIPRDITFLLSIIPRAETYNFTKFVPENLVRLLRETIVPDYSTWKTAKDESQGPPVQSYNGRRPKVLSQAQPQPQAQFPSHNGGGQMYGGGQYNAYPVPQSPYGGAPVGMYGGAPPVPGYQAYQHMPPHPEPSRTGYGEVDEFGRSREPPVLQSAAAWQYQG